MPKKRDDHRIGHRRQTRLVLWGRMSWMVCSNRTSTHDTRAACCLPYLSGALLITPQRAVDRTVDYATLELRPFVCIVILYVVVIGVFCDSPSSVGLQNI